MGYLVTGISAFFQTLMAVACHNRKDRSSFVNEKSLVPVELFLLDTRCCFLRLVTSSSCRIYYVTFGKKGIANNK